MNIRIAAAAMRWIALGDGVHIRACKPHHDVRTRLMIIPVIIPESSFADRVPQRSTIAGGRGS
jgi:hypothetical protein